MNVNLKKFAVTATMAGAVGGMAALGVGIGAAHADQNFPVPPIPVPHGDDLRVNLPDLKGPNVGLSGPDVGLNGPDIGGLNGPDIGLNGPDIGLNGPDIDGTRVSFPDVDIPAVHFPANVGWNDFVHMPPGHIGQLLGIPPGQLKKYEFINVNGVQQRNPFYGNEPGEWGDIAVPGWWRES